MSKNIYNFVLSLYEKEAWYTQFFGFSKSLLTSCDGTELSWQISYASANVNIMRYDNYSFIFRDMWDKHKIKHKTLNY